VWDAEGNPRADPAAGAVGGAVDGMRVIREGLTAGDLVIVDAVKPVKEGDTVKGRRLETPESRKEREEKPKR
jgi:hypothetical protein